MGAGEKKAGGQAPPDAKQPEWTPPAELGEYRLLRLLGKGAMGQVWLAEDKLLERKVAIKFATALDADEPRLRFRIEARAIARLRHPNIISVHHAGELEERPYMVTEVLAGKSLDRLKTPIEPSLALDLGVQLARGLVVAHRGGILHRDIKPANAFRCDDGSVKLLDFGLAKLTDPQSDSELEQLVRQEQARPFLAPALPTDSMVQKTHTRVDFQLTDSTEGARAADTQTHRVGVGNLTEGAARVAGAASTVTPAPSQALPTLASGQSSSTRTQPSAASFATVRTDITGAGALVGTPLYMAPELWRGGTASPRTDVYSMGAMLYELLAGRTPFAGGNLLALRFAVMTEPVVPLRGAPGVPDALADLVARCLDKSAAERPTTEALRDELEAIAAESRGSGAPSEAQGDPGQNPYPGLGSFDRHTAGLFFGREAETRQVLAELQTHGLVVVTGPSGSGKSSLVLAGVGPAVEQGRLGKERWQMVTFEPGRRPLESLCQAATAVLGPALAAALDETGDLASPAALQARLEQQPSWLAQLLRTQGSRTLFVIDQLEELFELPAGPRALFVQVLGELCSSTPAVRLLCTLRSDYLSRLSELGDLRSELLRGSVVLGPLREESLRRAVAEPAHRRGYQLESALLLAELVRGGQLGSLSLLQFALAQLWEARNEARQQLTSAALQAMGGLEGALARHADQVLAALPAAALDDTRQLVVRLVDLQGRRVSREEDELLAGMGARAKGALARLVAGRLVIVGEGERGTAYELAHDALLDGWPRLRGWLQEEHEARRVEVRLAAAAEEWERLGRSDDGLWAGRQLAELHVLGGRAQGPRQCAFTLASQRAEERARRRRLALRLAPALLILAVLGGVGLAIEIKERAERSALLAEASRLADQAGREERQLLALRQQALSRFDAGDEAGGEPLWKESRRRAASADELRGRAGRELQRALRNDAGHRQARSLAADLVLARLLASRRDHQDELGAQLYSQLQLHDDGQRRRRLGRPARVQLTVSPPGAALAWTRYQHDDRGRLTSVPVDGPVPLAGRPLELPAGSYLLRATLAGHAELRLPFLVEPGEPRTLTLRLLPVAAVPSGLVHVPAGRFIYGSSDNEETRRLFEAVPAHPVEQPAFLMARHEVTYGEYLAFLRALPPAQRARHGAAHLTLGADGKATAQPSPFAPTQVPEGQPYCPSHLGRCVDWKQLPYDRTTFAGAQAYAAWLASSGRVPGARLCTDREWERAARGADLRRYPHGDDLRAGDACTLASFGGDRSRAGPCEVGSHPRSQSPFGVHDLTGNLWEWVDDGHGAEAARMVAIGRGSSWEADDLSLTTVNRARFPRASQRLIGIRICASAGR